MAPPVSTNMIAERLGLSQATVSHILTGRGRFSQATRDRVRAAAREMGYRPSASARAMRSRRTRQVGALIRNDQAARFYYLAAYEMLLGLNSQLEEAGLLLTIVRLDDARRGLEAQSRVFSEHLLDGIVVLEDVPLDVQDRLDGLVEQVVWLDSTRDHPSHCVRRDERMAGRLAGEAALRAGYRRLIWAGPVENDTLLPPMANGFRHYSVGERLGGLRESVGTIPVETAETSPHLFDSTVPRAAAIAPGDCVIAYDTVRARQVVYALASAGRPVGGDVGLACCDNTCELDQLWPHLARVDVNRYELGRRAARMMIDALSGDTPASHVETVRWIPGTTLSGPPGLATS
jgi:LacI family transcriptional regulator